MLFLYDQVPGGTGLAEALFTSREALVREAKQRIRTCPCFRGCPSCVGPSIWAPARTKEVAAELLERILQRIALDLAEDRDASPR